MRLPGTPTVAQALGQLRAHQKRDRGPTWELSNNGAINRALNAGATRAQVADALNISRSGFYARYRDLLARRRTDQNWEPLPVTRRAGAYHDGMTAPAQDRFARAVGNRRGADRVDFDDYLATLGPVNLEQFAGCFEEGWTNDDEDDGHLRAMGEKLGYRLVILWDEAEDSLLDDRAVFSGHSDLYVLTPDGCLRDMPMNFPQVYLGDADTGYVIDASQVGKVIFGPSEFRMVEDHHAVYINTSA